MFQRNFEDQTAKSEAILYSKKCTFILKNEMAKNIGKMASVFAV